jgi:nucleoside-diphosphate-sugar epimerase
MRILVTGATGFVGRHLVKHLAEQHTLYCLSRRRDPVFEQFNAHIILGDLLQPLDYSSLPERLDSIIHLASVNAPFPDKANESFQVITTSTQQLLDYGRRVGIQRFIYASSGSVYGFGPRPWKEEDPLQLPNFYAVNKYCSELLVKAYSEFFFTCVLRIFFPYGPGQEKRRIPMIIERVKEGKPVVLVNEGQPTINPIYIDDLVRLIIKALSLDQHVVVNVAGDQTIDMKGLAYLVGSFLGKTPIFENTVDPKVSDMIADTHRMHQLLNVGSLTSLEEGLRRTLGL